MTDVWSGGLAFSYFPASGAGHEFDMATLSSDNSGVTTNTDFDDLVSQYAMVSFVTTLTWASAAQSTFGACPAVVMRGLTGTMLTPEDSVANMPRFIAWRMSMAAIKFVLLSDRIRTGRCHRRKHTSGFLPSDRSGTNRERW
jgi:hypothetical protein